MNSPESLIDFIDLAIDDYADYKKRYPGDTFYFCLNQITLDKWLAKLKTMITAMGDASTRKDEGPKANAVGTLTSLTNQTLIEKSYSMRDIVAFLCGEISLDGIGFGDRHPTERGLYWWRKYLKAAFEAIDHEPREIRDILPPEQQVAGDVGTLTVREYVLDKEKYAVVPLGYVRAKYDTGIYTGWTHNIRRIGDKICVKMTKEFHEGPNYRDVETFEFALPCVDLNSIEDGGSDA